MYDLSCSTLSQNIGRRTIMTSVQRVLLERLHAINEICCLNLAPSKWIYESYEIRNFQLRSIAPTLCKEKKERESVAKGGKRIEEEADDWIKTGLYIEMTKCSPLRRKGRNKNKTMNGRRRRLFDQVSLCLQNKQSRTSDSLLLPACRVYPSLPFFLPLSLSLSNCTAIQLRSLNKSLGTYSNESMEQALGLLLLLLHSDLFSALQFFALFVNIDKGMEDSRLACLSLT